MVIMIDKAVESMVNSRREERLILPVHQRRGCNAIEVKIS